MSKYTAAELVEFYQKVADGGEIEGKSEYSYATWQLDKWGPNLASDANHHRIKPTKKKIIDLQPLLNSGIDCEFSDDFEDWHIGGLIGIHNSSHNKRQFYEDYLESNWGHCRPRMNHKMCHDGSTPIAGFVVRVDFNPVDFTVVNTSDNIIHWPHVTAIEYLRVEDGYAYQWEGV